MMDIYIMGSFYPESVTPHPPDQIQNKWESQQGQQGQAGAPGSRGNRVKGQQGQVLPFNSPNIRMDDF